MSLTTWLAKPLARLRLPKIDGQIQLAGLRAAVEVRRDEWGVPHIYASNLPDLFFAQGFVHAQDRLFQMDFNRRLVAGRLAEVLGPPALPLDRWMRTLTMRRVAEFEVNLLDETTRAYLQAYANGINAFLAQARLPLEFALLRYRPQPWTPADSLAWIKMMAWSLSVNWEAELLRARLQERLGPELAAELEPLHLQRWPYVIPPGSDFSAAGQAALERADQARPFSGPSPYEGLGSNNWVLSGQRTAGGAPLLANDMHLSLGAPAVWYENHLCCLAGGEQALDATGVIFPGLPGVIAGHNGRVAWGFTNGFPDVQDLYLERLRRLEDGRVQAEYNGDWEDVRLLHETIQVKGRPAVVEEVVITRHGPVINTLAPDFSGEQPLALRWTALEPDTMVQALFILPRAQDVHELHQALRSWTTPAQNVVYADTQGNIGYTFAGKIPLRARGRGRQPVPGWTSEYEWVGYIPFEALPHLLNPPQGYIATANNRAIPADYPLQIELEPISGDRAQRIAEMILDASLRAGQDRIDLAFIQRMQYDQLSASARVMTRYLSQLPLDRSAHTPETDLHAAVRLFKAWDGTLAADSAAAALYQVFIRRMMALMLARRLERSAQAARKDPPGSPRRPKPGRSSLVQRWMGRGPTPVLAEKSWSGEHWLPWLTHLLGDPNSAWFDLGQPSDDARTGARRDALMRWALREAIDELKRTQTGPMNTWQWGKLHHLTFRHPLAANPLMNAIFNRGPYPIGGDYSTLWAAGASYHDLEDDSMVGPPYRMIVDLGDLGRSCSLLAPGQSGNPASPHYDDQVQPWFNGQYHPMLYARADVEQHTRHTLALKP